MPAAKQECADKRCPLVATLQHAAAPRLCQPVLRALGVRISAREAGIRFPFF